MDPKEEMQKEQRKIEKAAEKEKRRIEKKRKKEYWSGIKMIFAATICLGAVLVAIFTLVGFVIVLVNGEDIELYWLLISLGSLIFFSGIGYVLYKNGRKLIRENKAAK